MASFYCTLSPVDGDGTQLSVYARFTGGASDYTDKRSIDIRITGVGTILTPVVMPDLLKHISDRPFGTHVPRRAPFSS